ncbi:MAG: hypothetical protein QOE44_32 [Solirubrobacteraceae bacterium]|nr:hypothetical protein [Solirubrobacteraceae bacterium]
MAEVDRLKRRGDRVGTAGAISAILGLGASYAGSSALVAVGFAGLGLLLLTSSLALRAQERKATGLTPVSLKAIGVAFAVAMIILFVVVLILAAQDDSWSALAGLGR